jgi:D-alanyl-D-alanine carboxypeptidase
MERDWSNWQQLIVRPRGEPPVYNCLLAVHGPGEGIDYERITGQEDAQGTPVVGPYRFRVASITKLFTATLIGQLAEAGALRLTDGFLTLLPTAEKDFLRDLLYVDGQNRTAEITVDQLLRHRSGLRDYFADDKRFFAYAQRHPDQQWTWRETLTHYYAYELHRRATQLPGAAFHYADTNYLLLAVLVEALTGMSFATALRERIIAPLGLADTYLEFFEAYTGALPMLYPYYETESLQGVNTSFDWGGGGLVSTAADLERFARALFTGELLRRPATLDQLLPAAGEDYGRGVAPRRYGAATWYGHTGFYGTLLFFDPTRQRSVVIATQQAAALRKAEWLLGRVAG